jgi:tetratricopeptide (TPR) repeat protein
MLMGLGIAATFVLLRVMNEASPKWWNRYLAVFASTWFCIHTANTETVNYLSARSDLLSTLAVVLAFCVYFLPAPARRRYWCVLPMAIGALVKTPAVVFAPLLLVYALLFEERLSGPDLFRRTAWPHLRSTVSRCVPVLAAGVVLFLLVEGMNPDTVVSSQHSRVGYLITQPFVWLDYLRLFFVPIGLTADAEWELLRYWYDTRLFAGLLGLGLLSWLAWRASTSHVTRPVAFGLIWFAVALAPTSSLFPLSEVSSEHPIFFPYLGLTLAVVWGVRIVIERWAAAAPRLVAVAVGLVVFTILTGNAYATHVRNRVWLSDESLWSDVVEKSPNNGRAWMNYGLTQMAQGRYARTKELFDRAAVLTPNYSTLEINLGIVTDQLGDQVAAERHFRRALELSADRSSYFYLARWFAQRARAPEAIPLLEQSLQLSPGFTLPRDLLTNLHYAMGDRSGVQALIDDTVVVSPADPVAGAYARGATPFTSAVVDAASAFSQGVELTGQSRHLEAAVTYRHALELSGEPAGQGWETAADAWNNLGWELAQLGVFEEAIGALERAVALRPDYELAANNLVWAREELATR